MTDPSKRPPVRIRFRFNVETGETEFVIDDDAPDRSEEYHDKVAEAIAGFLSRHPEIKDAGNIRHRMERERQEKENVEKKRDVNEEKNTLTE